MSVRDTPVRPDTYRRGAAPVWAYGRIVKVDNRRTLARLTLEHPTMRWQWPRTRTAVGFAAGVAAFAATAVLALTQNGGAKLWISAVAPVPSTWVTL